MMKQRLCALLLCLPVLLTACGGPGYCADPLSLGGRTVPAEAADLNGPGALAATDFAVALLQRTDGGGNVLLSPISVLSALAMTANGAAGETRAQLEDVLGLPAEEWNIYLQTLADALPEDKEARCCLANSVWFQDGEDHLMIEQAFLTICSDHYGADLFRAPFDGSTLKDINAWTADRTDGLIPAILDRLPGSTVIYLINALAFDGRWENVYRENQIHDGTFTAAGGEEQRSQMMYSREYMFLEDDLATGFLKYYEGRTYAFAALQTAIPQFTVQYQAELSGALSGMGMADAFNAARADFSAMGSSPDGPLYISRVLHSTALSLDAQGTRAGAATAVEMDAGADQPSRNVYLDRPFLYLLIDCQAELPLFIGAVRSLEP